MAENKQPETMVEKFLRNKRLINSGRYQPKHKSGYTYLNGRPTKRRVVISGEANMGKSTSLNGFDKPHRIIVAPGEMGTDAIPRDDGISTVVFEQEANDIAGTVEILSDFYDEVHQAINNPEWATVSVDGLHKLYKYIIDAATNGAASAGLKFDGKLYYNAHQIFDDFMAILCHSSIPTVVFTTWCERDHIDTDLTFEQKAHYTRFMLPMLPGKMARQILGNVNSGFVHADLTFKCDMPDCDLTKKKQKHFTWQLKPNLNNDNPNPNTLDENRDCGFKLPRGYELPELIHQDWPYLKALLDKAWE